MVNLPIAREVIAFFLSDVSFWVESPNVIARTANHFRRQGAGPVRAWFEAACGWELSREQRIRFSYRFPLLLIALVGAVALWEMR